MNERIGRNDLCPCGSGKKYKRCCLAEESRKPRPIHAAQAITVPPSHESPAIAWDGDVAPSDAPERPRDEWDDWYDRYNACSFVEQIDLLRGLLAEDRPPEFYTDLEFVGTVLALQPKDANERDLHYAFLDEMYASRPDVFGLGADWFVRQFAYACVRRGRAHDIDRVLPAILDDTYRLDEPVFDLADLLRLCGLDEASRQLTFAIWKQTERGGFTPWACDEIVEFAIYFLFRAACNADCTPAAVEALRTQLAQRRCHPDENKFAAMLAHRSGAVRPPIELNDLLTRDESASFNVYLLLLDFGRWLTKERAIPPLVADTMRCFVHWCLIEMSEKSDRNPLVLHKERLDKYLARLMGFMSLSQLRAVATLLGMRHLCDFLFAERLINEGEHRRRSRTCDNLWTRVQQALGDSAPDYAFLDRYAYAPT